MSLYLKAFLFVVVFVVVWLNFQRFVLEIHFHLIHNFSVISFLDFVSGSYFLICRYFKTKDIMDMIWF